MARKFSKRALAASLGISPAMVTKLAKRGMPCDSTAAATVWRAANLDPRLTKHQVKELASAVSGEPDAGHDSEPGLRRRWLKARVLSAERDVANEGSEDLPANRVEKGILTGLMLLRASIHGSTSHMHSSVEKAIGTEATHKLLYLLDDWWRGVHDSAADALFRGLVRDLPGWGRGFHHRYILQVRGNFPDRPHFGEPELDGEVGGK